MEFVRYILAILAAYLLGSFPTGVLAARLFKGVDPRQHGSGRTGGTNILRTAGKGAALTTVVGDLLKGLLAVMIARQWLGTQSAAVLAGLAAVVGHNRSIFLRFRGGAGSMTNTGVVLAMVVFAVTYVVSVVMARRGGGQTRQSLFAAGQIAQLTCLALYRGFWPLIHG